MKETKIDLLGWKDKWVPKRGGVVYNPSTDRIYLIGRISGHKVELLDCESMIINQFGYCNSEWSLSSEIIPSFNFGIDIIMPDINQMQL